MSTNQKRLGRVGVAIVSLAVLLCTSLFTPVPGQTSAGAADPCGTFAALPSAVGLLHGIDPVHSAPGACPRARSLANVATPFQAVHASNAYDGLPPLYWRGGIVAGGTTPGSLVVTPIFWVPPKTTPIPTNYELLQSQFLTDVAVAGAQPGNVFSGLQQYTAGSLGRLHLSITAAPQIVVTDALPTATADRCSHDVGPVYADGSSYTSCVTSQGVYDEVNHVVSTYHLPVDSRHAYSLYMAEGVEGCEGTQNGAHGGICTATPASTAGYCGWHSSSFGSTAQLLFLSMPWPVYHSATGATCEVTDAGYNQFPHGAQNAAGDVELSILSHEIAETVTDPTSSGWTAVDGSEIGDLCTGAGGVVSGPAGQSWNQTLNGHHYILQEEFSNATYAKNANAGCLQAWTSPTVVVSAPSTVVHGATIHVSCSPASAASVMSSLSCTWKVDGVTVPPTTRTAAAFVLSAVGMHTVTATVTDAAGFSGTSTATVHAT